MKGAVYEKKILINDTHEFQLEKEHILLNYVKLLVVGAGITVGRGGKAVYPMADGTTLILQHVDAATLYINGAGTGETIYIIGTAE